MGGSQDRIHEDLDPKKSILLTELRDRSLWFVRLRWWVPPSIVCGTWVALGAGFDFPYREILGVAGFILLYNVFFYVLSRRYRQEPVREESPLRRFAYGQVGLDYAAMFLLAHFTGGAASPFIFFFIFHIIFTSILLPTLSAYGVAALVVTGMCTIAFAEYQGWIQSHSLFFRGRDIDLVRHPFHMIVELGFFGASVFITAWITSAIMKMLRARIRALGELSESVTLLNNKLNALFSVIQAIGSAQRLEQVLNIATSELQLVMGVRGISVKMLSEDGKRLRYAAAYGLPDELFQGREVEVDKSMLNRRIVDGEPYLTGEVTEKEKFQFGEALEAAHIRSVLFVPLTVEGRVIGILGAYCVYPHRFSDADVDFFRLAAGLVAIAIENARAYEATERLVRERSSYMTQVTRYLRAPLSDMLGIMERAGEGDSGDLNDNQREYLRRLDRRARTMLSTIHELTSLLESRGSRVRFGEEPVDLAAVAGRIQRTFQDEAAEKGICLNIDAPADLPVIRGDAAMIEQLFENLLSNAIKYTPSGGQVGVTFAGLPHTVRIEVRDTGIGIPKAEMPNLFKEFFRAENARKVEAHGTGLGLAIVKEIVEKHGGQIRVESGQGSGTAFVIHLPVARQKANPAPIGVEDPSEPARPDAAR